MGGGGGGASVGGESERGIFLFVSRMLLSSFLPQNVGGYPLAYALAIGIVRVGKDRSRG